jgi:hypothetical protein
METPELWRPADETKAPAPSTNVKISARIANAESSGSSAQPVARTEVSRVTCDFIAASRFSTVTPRD